MTRLLDFIARYLSFLYLSDAYRFTDSSHRGLADIDASVTLSGDTLRWDVTNDRGQFDLLVVPLRPEGNTRGYWLSLIRQYLEGGADTDQGTILSQLNWLQDNLNRVEALFADDAKTEKVCAELESLKRLNSYKNWGWPKPEA